MYTITLENLKQLIEGCKKQEPRSQKIMYERFYGYALKISFRYIYRYDIAANVVNDAFVKLFRHFEKFRNEDDEILERMLMGWIRRIVINTSIDELRKNNMTPEIGGIPEHVWEEADKSQKADQLLLYKELITYVKSLPPTYRIVFNMFVIDGCSHFEIADALGISIGTSKSNLSRARTFLQKLIKEKEDLKTWNI
ncbi:MAG: RNA polymerase sigma factor [Bacteroidota bacterium]|nr:RNA polymerase sigma factor [Bacteroidota bacterium]MDP4211084.1 RNA polymerase sigma factor [Bacteroidota bacterium]MDP4249181.1 RNA polymerase sigma factor [Bacteroidota bacterium]